MTIGIETLESLLGTDEPSGTFHDSSLLSLNIDYDKKLLRADFDIYVGDPEGKDEQARKRYRPGCLRIEGLKDWSFGSWSPYYSCQQEDGLPVAD